MRATRDDPTRRALTLVDRAGERTITTLGRRLAPSADDPLPWDRLDEADAVYVTAGDAGAFRRARRARVMVVTSRVLGDLLDADVVPDALVGSDRDLARTGRRRVAAVAAAAARSDPGDVGRPLRDLERSERALRGASTCRRARGPMPTAQATRSRRGSRTRSGSHGTPTGRSRSRPGAGPRAPPDEGPSRASGTADDVGRTALTGPRTNRRGLHGSGTAGHILGALPRGVRVAHPSPTEVRDARQASTSAATPGADHRLGRPGRGARAEHGGASRRRGARPRRSPQGSTAPRGLHAPRPSRPDRAGSRSRRPATS